MVCLIKPQFEAGREFIEKKGVVKDKNVHIQVIKNIIELSSNENDVIWDPFGGLFTSAVACNELNRICYSAEINPEVYEIAVNRVKEELK